jgi:hypothetical protein
VAPPSAGEHQWPSLPPAPLKPPHPAPVVAPAALRLDPAQQETVLAELDALAPLVLEPRARGGYAELRRAVEGGEVGPDAVDRLEGLVALSLETGRARRVHGAEGEQALRRLFQQTPRGSAALAAAAAVNRGLQTLAGQVLEGMLFTVQGPGIYKLGIRTDRCSLTIEIDRDGVSAESLEI